MAAIYQLSRAVTGLPSASAARALASRRLAVLSNAGPMSAIFCTRAQWRQSRHWPRRRRAPTDRSIAAGPSRFRWRTSLECELVRPISLDHLVGKREQRRRHRQAKRLRGLQIDHQLELGGLQYRQFGGLGAFENAPDIEPRLVIIVAAAAPVAHQSAGHGELARIVAGGNHVTRG